MVQIENIRVVERFKKALAKVISIRQLVLFGSRAKGDFQSDSDFDVLVVSSDFEGMPVHLRAKKTYPIWSDERPVELLCYTPKEAERRAKSPVRNVVADALKEGVII